MKKLFKLALAQAIVVMVLAVTITILAAAGMMADFRMETNLDRYMPAAHPAFVFSDEADERFMIRDAILIALEHPDTIYNPDSLGKIIQIDEALRSIDGLSESRVQSVYTGDNILDTTFGLQFIQDLILDYEEALMNEQFTNTATIAMVRTFASEMVRLEMLASSASMMATTVCLQGPRCRSEGWQLFSV